MKDLERDYRRAGFGNRLGFGERPALVVVDMVMAYFEPSSPLYAGVEGIVAPAKAVLEAARAAGVPVIYTVVRYHPSGRDGGWFFRKVSALKVFAGDGPLGAIHTAMAPSTGPSTRSTPSSPRAPTSSSWSSSMRAPSSAPRSPQRLRPRVATAA